MNWKNNIIYLLLLILTISCTSQEVRQEKENLSAKQTINTKHLIGSWKDKSSAALHFSLFSDGSARSDNMKTLLYQKWSAKDNKLTLTIKSIGNGNSSVSEEIFDIYKLDKECLILKQDHIIFEYSKSGY
ncbi:MAG: lipocalin family protein [Candidatus Tenebribacter davisii]|nr:lipocalin family protein [Candidatus Tenebribacter davisii]